MGSDLRWRVWKRIFQEFASRRKNDFVVFVPCTVHQRKLADRAANEENIQHCNTIMIPACRKTEWVVAGLLLQSAKAESRVTVR